MNVHDLNIPTGAAGERDHRPDRQIAQALCVAERP